MLEYYEQFLSVLLGWADEPLQKLIEQLRAWTSMPWSLAPGWKHVFVLLWLYFSSDTKTKWPDWKSFAVFSIVLGGVTALVSSVAIGMGAVGAPRSRLLPAMVPMAAVFVYELIRAVWNATFSDRTYPLNSPGSFDASSKTWSEVFVYCLLSYALPIWIVGALALGIAWLVGSFLPSGIDMTIFSLFCFVVVLAFYLLARGAFRASYYRNECETRIHRFKRSKSTHLGLLLLTTMLGTMLFVALNTGLKLVGL
jgi:hypothetical protein